MPSFQTYKLFVSFYLILAFVSCIDKDQPNTYWAMFENSSAEDLIVFTYDVPEQPPVDSTTILSGETQGICFYNAFEYASFSCLVSQIKIVFPNQKGYLCTKGNSLQNESPLCFQEMKDPFLGERLPNEGLGTYFLITQEDFENAEDLP